MFLLPELQSNRSNHNIPNNIVINANAATSMPSVTINAAMNIKTKQPFIKPVLTFSYSSSLSYAIVALPF